MVLILFGYVYDDNYWVYTFENGDSYASVLEMNDIFVLKRIDIGKNTIKLFLDEQIIVDAGDKVFKYYIFENVLVEK